MAVCKAEWVAHVSQEPSDALLKVLVLAQHGQRGQGINQGQSHPFVLCADRNLVQVAKFPCSSNSSLRYQMGVH